MWIVESEGRTWVERSRLRALLRATWIYFALYPETWPAMRVEWQTFLHD